MTRPCGPTAEVSRTMIGVFLYSRDPRFKTVSFLISVNRDLDFFLFSEIRDQKPPLPLLKFSSMEKVFKLDIKKIYKHFFLQFSSVFFKRHSPLMPPS